MLYSHYGMLRPIKGVLQFVSESAKCHYYCSVNLVGTCLDVAIGSHLDPVCLSE